MALSILNELFLIDEIDNQNMPTYKNKKTYRDNEKDNLNTLTDPKPSTSGYLEPKRKNREISKDKETYLEETFLEEQTEETEYTALMISEYLKQKHIKIRTRKEDDTYSIKDTYVETEEHLDDVTHTAEEPCASYLKYLEKKYTYPKIDRRAP